jgi:hypothetical protein
MGHGSHEVTVLLFSVPKALCLSLYLPTPHDSHSSGTLVMLQNSPLAQPAEWLQCPTPGVGTGVGAGVGTASHCDCPTLPAVHVAFAQTVHVVAPDALVNVLIWQGWHIVAE